MQTLKCFQFFKIFYFFAHKKLEKLPQKLLIIGPNLYFHSPTHSQQPKIFHIIKISHQASVLLSVIRIKKWFKNWSCEKMSTLSKSCSSNPLLLDENNFHKSYSKTIKPNLGSYISLSLDDFWHLEGPKVNFFSFYLVVPSWTKFMLEFDLLLWTFVLMHVSKIEISNL